ncbi:hypothetical protein GYH30_041932 [Glycine max]|nr:hypothetical protein GYH30_041932 [Glycine max]
MSSMALDARSVMSENDVCKCFFTNWGSTTRDFHRLHTQLNCSGLLTLIQTRISIIRPSGRPPSPPSCAGASSSSSPW